MKKSKPASGSPKRRKIVPDERRQLFNRGVCGPFSHIQLAEAEITCLRGILLDVDPQMFRKQVAPLEVRRDPEKFYEQVVAPWLRNNAVLRKAEVRNSGTGLHIIPWFDQPVVFESEGDRRRWAGIVRTIQRLLPTDPDSPGITAVTRSLGSVNTKNNAKVKRLVPGEPVTAAEVLDLYGQVRSAPFRTVAGILFRSDRIAPCPVCDGSGCRLDALDREGRCYGGCGRVRLGQLFDTFLKPRPTPEA